MVFEDKILKEVLNERNITDQKDLNLLFKDIISQIMHSVLKGEMTYHLGYEKYEQGKSKAINNSRNGSTFKKVKSDFGKININTPRDRNSTFKPKLIEKRKRDISGLKSTILSLYSKGVSTRDISSHIEEIYGVDISRDLVSNITDSVNKDALEWQNRQLDPIYSVIFMDGFVVKIRSDDGIVKNHTVYGIIGINMDGFKHVLGLYIGESESSKYWLTVMNELKDRGIKDVLIFSVDNLSGISEAINTAFPKSDIQKCIVHQIRNSFKFVSWKDYKEIARDLKPIYTASNEKAGYISLEEFAKKWDKKYSYISKSWEKNWSELSTFFKYSKEIKTLIYTTNPIESFNRSMRKIIKNKTSFPTKVSLLKILYLATNDLEKKWKTRTRNWGCIYSNFKIYFKERLDNVSN